MTEATGFQGADMLFDQYNVWRGIYARMGKASRDEPDWEGNQIWFRDGYPHPDWSAFVIAKRGEGFDLLQASTERRSDAVMSHQGFFSRLEDAGKFIIAAIGDYLRIDLRMDPVSWIWMDLGLAPNVEETIVSDSEVTYRLRDDHEVYSVMALGDRPYSHLLPMSYSELNQVLLQGFPDEVKPPV